MLIPVVILTALSAAACLVWMSRHLRIWREQRDGFLLTGEYGGPPSGAPSLSVVIAAKDEAECIESCVRTMLQQDYPDFEVLVCNDRSQDQTPAILERLAGQDGRLRVFHIDHLPDGWKGKNNAMQIGIAAARGEWICMVDADCRQLSHRTLSAAMQYAFDTRSDFLSVLPQHEMVGFWENVAQPVGTGVMMIWFDPQRVNDPRKPHAYANGAFMLMTRSAYQTIGTHEAFKECLNEDMHMAARAKGAGLRLRVVRSRGLEVLRMYTSPQQMLRGWSRIFLGTFGTLKRLTASLGLLVVMGLLPYAAAALGFALAARGTAPNAWWWACGVAGAAGAAMQVSVIYRFYKLIGARKELAWSYPLGCAFMVVCLILSLAKCRKGARITWRDTSYSSTAGS